jgi:hypothetical protein
VKLYVLGPMTGLPDFNAQAFRDAATDLRARGHEVISPVEMDEAEDFEHTSSDGSIADDVKREFLRRDFQRILDEDPDGGAALPGWETSEGAQAEAALLRSLKRPILQYPELIVLERHPASERFHAILHSLGALHDRKQRDYGRDNDPFANVRASEEWTVEPWIGAMIRATDKVRRLQTFAAKGTLANEGVVDAFDDLAVYAVIGRVLFEETAG